MLRWTLCVWLVVAGWMGAVVVVEAQAEPEQPTPEILLAQDGGGDATGDKRTSSKKEREDAMKALAGQYPAKAGGDDPGSAPANNSGSAPAMVAPPAGSDSMVRMEHHGYFRLRTDLFYNMDLNTKGTSPIPSPLRSNDRNPTTQTQGATNGDETLTSLNMRFRYAPVFNIKEHLRVHTTFDIFDNIVLGSTPDGIRGARPDVANPALTRSSEQPQLSTVGKDAIEVREVYGEIVWTFGTFRAGRMANDWGLGMVLNGGSQYNAARGASSFDGQNWRCLDCDYGDYIDRLQFEVRDPFSDLFYLSLAWDFPSTGLATYNAGLGNSPLAAQSFGQPFDLDPGDDVTQFTIAIFDKPISQEELVLRKHALEKGKMQFDWGALLVIRYQDNGLDRPATAADYTGPTTGAAADGSAPQFRPFNLSVLTPDIWVRLLLPIGAKRYVRLEAELSAVFGSLSGLTNNTLANSELERSMTQFGAAIESELRWDDFFAYFNTGFASGSDGYGFGYLDADRYTNPDPRTNQFSKNINNFQFNRNYMVDMIMFRELVGGITNAIYFNPAFAYRLADLANAREETSLGVRLDFITAAALNKDSTPGRGQFYGFETDLKLFYEERNDYRLEASTGLFIPGDVWDRNANDDVEMPTLPDVYEITPADLDSGLTANLAWTLQANFWWMF